MALLVPAGLPAIEILRSEGLRIEEKNDIGPALWAKDAVHIAILNLMPTKEVTETQLLRMLDGDARLVDITLLKMETHTSKNTAQEHLDRFYTTLHAVRNLPMDGLIVTGAPVEMLAFEEVDYWPELEQIMDWANANVKSTFYICWAAQAALYHFYGIHKYPLSDKCFGIFTHTPLQPEHPLLTGFDSAFPAPHSRHTEIRMEDLETLQEVRLLAKSDEAGAYLAASEDNRSVFVIGHSEYDADTLKREYDRDVSRGLKISMPRHYFPGDDPTKQPPLTWRKHARLLYQNWVTKLVCQ